MFDRKLIFENGDYLFGKGFGSKRESMCEIVFNTSMVGYPEIFSDLSYYGQMVCMTYPWIGNYGMNQDDYETKFKPGIDALVIHEYNNQPSNFRSTRTLAQELEHYDIPGIYGVDTRYITHMIRSHGSMRVALVDINQPVELIINKLKNININNHVACVSCKKIWHSNIKNAKFNIILIDCGVKYNIIRILNQKLCNITIVPHDISLEYILDANPDGIVLSNGPGDPRDNKHLVNLIKNLDNIPIFGICLGHQLIALANNAEIIKLKFGHRGANHPVKNLETNKIEITSQNHSYSVDKNSLDKTNLKITHINLLDNTIEGLEVKNKNIFSVQYHPESAPGPHDSLYLFDKFINNMIYNMINHSTYNYSLKT